MNKKYINIIGFSLYHTIAVYIIMYTINFIQECVGEAFIDITTYKLYVQPHHRGVHWATHWLPGVTHSKIYFLILINIIILNCGSSSHATMYRSTGMNSKVIWCSNELYLQVLRSSKKFLNTTVRNISRNLQASMHNKFKILFINLHEERQWITPI